MQGLDHYMFETVTLPGGGEIFVGRVPPLLVPSGPAAASEQFEALWELRTERPIMCIQGRVGPIPRWQQSYGGPYTFSHQTSKPLPIPPMLQRFLDWGREAIDERVNRELVNWYAAPGDSIGADSLTKNGDYIGAHRDDDKELIPGSPIVTISIGGQRVFRMRRYRGKGFEDIPVGNGTVIVLPFATNQQYTHEVPPPRRHEQGRRISITLRAFV